MSEPDVNQLTDDKVHQVFDNIGDVVKSKDGKNYTIVLPEGSALANRLFPYAQNPNTGKNAVSPDEFEKLNQAMGGDSTPTMNILREPDGTVYLQLPAEEVRKFTKAALEKEKKGMESYLEQIKGKNVNIDWGVEDKMENSIREQLKKDLTTAILAKYPDAHNVQTDIMADYAESAKGEAARYHLKVDGKDVTISGKDLHPGKQASLDDQRAALAQIRDTLTPHMSADATSVSLPPPPAKNGPMLG